MADSPDKGPVAPEPCYQSFAFVLDQQAEVTFYERLMDSYARPDAESPEALLGVGYPIAPNLTNRVFVRCRGPLRLRDHAGQPLVNAEYTLILDGKSFRGRTDEDGWIAWFSRSGITKVELYVGSAGYTLEFGDIAKGSVAGGQAMLNALGFSAGPLDGDAGTRTKSATAYYQMRRYLPMTGELDANTLALLERDWDAGKG